MESNAENVQGITPARPENTGEIPVAAGRFGTDGRPESQEKVDHAEAGREAGPETTGAAGDPDSDSGLKQIEAEYPQYVKNGRPELPVEAMELKKPGMKLIDAVRLFDLANTRLECEKLKQQLEAERANHINTDASIGPLPSGGGEKAYYTPGEWDTLPKATRQKLIKSGKIYDFMKRWSGKK